MEKRIIDVNGFRFNMLPIESGQFVMGATIEQHGEAYDNESPAHTVKLDGFYLSEAVVTQSLWNAVIEDATEPSSELPVTGKNWYECQNFIDKLNSLTGRHFRLPTEAEWEYAARGGKMNRGCKYSGSNNLDDVAWYEKNSGRVVHSVKQKQPNELGFYDMSGNVWEWCADWYGEYETDEEREEAVLNPQGPLSGSQRVVRGAGNAYYAQSCRVSCRLPLEPMGGHYANTGFRLAMDENDSLDQLNGEAETASGVNAPPKSTPFMSKGGENPKRTSAKENKTGGNGHYWKPTGKGGQGKKKWPWFVAAGVALIVVIIVVSGGGKDTSEPPIDDSELVSEMPIETEKPTESEMPTETINQEILRNIDGARKLFANNQLVKYQPYDIGIDKLSEGWEDLLAAEKLLMDVNPVEYDDYEYSKRQIDTLKSDYISHIKSIYDDEVANLKSSNKDVVEQGKERIAQLERFSGIEEVKKNQ